MALANKFCDDGSDHYCSITCNRCQEGQNIIMLVGGFQRKPSRQWMLNPTFFALNGSLPSCLNSTKNNITNDGSLSRIRSPGLFTNQGDIMQHLVLWKKYDMFYSRRQSCYVCWSCKTRWLLWVWGRLLDMKYCSSCQLSPVQIFINKFHFISKIRTHGQLLELLLLLG